MRKIIGFSFVLALIILQSCRDNKEQITTPPKKVTVPAVNKDSIFSFLEKQLEFGYRVPGFPEHKACKDWFIQKFESYGADVIEQKFTGDFLGKTNVDGYNIIAQFNPAMRKRVLLAAHWDSRLIGEKDADESKRNSPIAGADDGASGVAALIEIARLISENPIDMGVDIILFDMEDQGEKEGDVESWCLGSQYWSKNLHKRGYKAKFGILLDMVGAKNASFGKEYYSRNFASKYVDKVWSLARRMGYSDLFVDIDFAAITDDHYYVNQYAGIPMLDIVNYDLKNNKFADYHHTSNDNIEVISKRNLRVVAQVVTAVIYNESAGRF